MIEVIGAGGITARIIADSISAIDGKRITTYELEYPRFIHSELMTHRYFSRNAASSRAIPVQKVIDMVRNSPAMPIHWGQNQPGMKAKEELSQEKIFDAQYLWKKAANFVGKIATCLNRLGLHKQATNRILEPFQMIKVVVTATEFDNFWWLRNHEDAQPEIHELARVMYSALQDSNPEELNPGEWHTPYVWGVKTGAGRAYGIGAGDDIQYLTLEEALKVSSSCCAQVSYRVLNTDLDKAIEIYDKLVTSEPVHASPFEHQATPIALTHMEFDAQYDVNVPFSPETWQDGITHVDRNGNFWSGNLQGWIQHRQLIPNNVCKKYEA